MFKDDFKLYPHKTDVNSMDWDSLRPNIKKIAKIFIEFAEKNNLSIMVTSIHRPDADKSASRSHQEYRAIDFRSIDWPGEKIKECESYMNKTCSNIGAISSRTGIVVACKWHDCGRGQHFHLQGRA